MTFTADNLSPSHVCIGVTHVNPPPHWDSNLDPQHERWTTYQLSYPSPLLVARIVYYLLNVLPGLMCFQSSFSGLLTHSNHVTSSKQVDTLICHTTICRNAINVLYIPGHVTLWCLEVVPMVYASDVVPRKNY